MLNDFERREWRPRKGEYRNDTNTLDFQRSSEIELIGLVF